MAAEQRVLPGALAVAAGTFGVVSLALTWAWNPSVYIEPPGPRAPLVLSARVIGELGVADAVLVLLVANRWARTICTSAAFFSGGVAQAVRPMPLREVKSACPARSLRRLPTRGW